MDQLEAKGVALRILNFGGDAVDTRGATGRLMLNMFAAMAQFELENDTCPRCRKPIKLAVIEQHSTRRDLAVCGSRLRLVPQGAVSKFIADYCSRHDAKRWRGMTSRFASLNSPLLPERRDLFEGLAEIKLEIRPLRPAEMGSAKVIGLAVGAFRSSRFINRVRP